jgi:hypothetical protein
MTELSPSPLKQALPAQPATPRTGRVLRGASAAACWLAVWTAILVLLLRAWKLFGGAALPLPAFFRSAVPLIAIGFAYLALVLSARRTLAERALGLCVSAAFIFWGTEQYLSNGAVIAALDDLVAFLFVLDLSIVIRRQLSQR